MTRRISLLAFLLVILVGGASKVLAQGVTTANLVGLVTDDSGSPLPGATVIAVHEPSGTQYGTISLNDGRFHFPNLRVGGPYKVTISFVGFNDKVEENIFLSLGQTYSLDASLVEGVELNAVEILAKESDVMNADRTGAATNISQEQIQSLPTIARSLQDFT
ncbi:MAG TPA: cell envelope biogenesis protein OmpA, partial [Microscillaceae bacterium]|nr:cell envelope biogenesis protein OmpA [Microscillaceae bacterium]